MKLILYRHSVVHTDNIFIEILKKRKKKFKNLCNKNHFFDVNEIIKYTLHRMFLYMYCMGVRARWKIFRKINIF